MRPHPCKSHSISGACCSLPAPVQGLGAETQSMKVLMQSAQRSLSGTWGGLAARGQGESSLRSLLVLPEARWPWHLFRAHLAGRGIVLLSSHLSFFVFCASLPLPFHQLLLEEYANSDPKLALTGIPIVQWPKRDKVGAAKRTVGGCSWGEWCVVCPVLCLLLGLGSTTSILTRERCRGTAQGSVGSPQCAGVCLVWGDLL